MEDICYNIFSWLSIYDIMKCSSVCKMFYNVTKLELLWKLLFDNKYDMYMQNKNNIITDPESFQYILNLQHSYYDKYKLCFMLNNLQEIIGCEFTTEYFFNLKNIWLCNRDIISIPIELALFYKLESICLSSYVRIPDELKYLQSINIYLPDDHQLQHIPNELKNLKNLKIYVGYDKLN